MILKIEEVNPIIKENILGTYISKGFVSITLRFLQINNKNTCAYEDINWQKDLKRPSAEEDAPMADIHENAFTNNHMMKF